MRRNNRHGNTECTLINTAFSRSRPTQNPDNKCSEDGQQITMDINQKHQGFVTCVLDKAWKNLDCELGRLLRKPNQKENQRFAKFKTQIH